MDIEIPFPNDSTNLFEIKSFGYHIACIQDLTIHAYASSYLDACKIILERMEKDNLFMSDTLVYPVVFLFRQYLELKFKHIILLGGRIVKKKEVIEDYGHNMSFLWQT